MQTRSELDRRDLQLLAGIARGPGHYPTPSPERAERLIERGLGQTQTQRLDADRARPRLRLAVEAWAGRAPALSGTSQAAPAKKRRKLPFCNHENTSFAQPRAHGAFDRHATRTRVRGDYFGGPHEHAAPDRRARPASGRPHRTRTRQLSNAVARTHRPADGAGARQEKLQRLGADPEGPRFGLAAAAPLSAAERRPPPKDSPGPRNLLPKALRRRGRGAGLQPLRQGR